MQRRGSGERVMSGENGTWYLDISECVSTLEKALKLARERGESALWDVAKAVQLRLPVIA